MGKKLKELRLNFGLTQAELAQKSGLRQTIICELEHGQRGVGIRTLAKLAKAFDTTPGKLLSDFMVEVA